MAGSKETQMPGRRRAKPSLFSVVTHNSLKAAASHCQLLGCCCQHPLQSATAALTCHTLQVFWETNGLVLHTHSENSRSQEPCSLILTSCSSHANSKGEQLFWDCPFAGHQHTSEPEDETFKIYLRCNFIGRKGLR